jgi:type IV pilus biogenesis protein CpaD/CtpE
MNKLSMALLALATSLLAACASTPQQTATQAAVAAKPAVAAINITGTWALNVETPMGAREMKLNATQTGEVLAGTIASGRGDMPVTGTVKGNAVAFMMKVNAQGMDLQIDYVGTVEGDAMKGTMKLGDMGEGTWTGKKQ